NRIRETLQAKLRIVLEMICTDRPMSRKLKRILDHVQLLNDGWIKSGKMNPPTIDVEFAG
ncbi:hypothetical protein N9W19_00775, partial [bacterium]|nr:hypothetical protein [bacterium]